MVPVLIGAALQNAVLEEVVVIGYLLTRLSQLGWSPRRAVVGPTKREDVITPHTRPPADEDAEHMLVRTVTCLDGEVEVELVCEPAFDYGRTSAEWSLGYRWDIVLRGAAATPAES